MGARLEGSGFGFFGFLGPLLPFSPNAGLPIANLPATASGRIAPHFISCLRDQDSEISPSISW